MSVEKYIFGKNIAASIFFNTYSYSSRFIVLVVLPWLPYWFPIAHVAFTPGELRCRSRIKLSYGVRSLTDARVRVVW